MSRGNTKDLSQIVDGYVVKSDDETLSGNSSAFPESEKIKSLLNYRIEIEKLVSDISGDFISVPLEKIDHEIMKALKKIGKFVNADRSFILLAESRNSPLEVKYEWCDSGVNHRIDYFEKIPLKSFKWAYQSLADDGHLSFGSIKDIPERAAKERKLFERYNINSALIVTLPFSMDTFGILGFESVKERKEWRAEDISILKMVGNIFVNALQKKKIDEALKHRIAVEKIISEISTRLLSLDSRHMDDVINDSLELIGRFAKADRSYVFLTEQNGKLMTNVYEWCAEGIEPQIDNLRWLKMDDFPWWKKQLEESDYIYVPSIANLPREAATEKEVLLSQSIKSLISVPMISNNNLIGFIGFDAVKKPIEWLEDDIVLLKLMAEIFAGALNRGQIEESLKCLNIKLEKERLTLRSKNSALKEILNHVEDEKKQLAVEIDSKIRKIVMPLLIRIKSNLNETESSDLNLAISTLTQVTRPFLKDVDWFSSRLSPRELEICNMIKNGYSSKEIAFNLQTSIHTIHNHRRNIRKKLSLDQNNASLTSILQHTAPTDN